MSKAPVVGFLGLSFSIRPPRGYELEVSQDSHGGALFLWHGQRRADKSAATFSVLPITRPSDGPPLTAGSFLAAGLASPVSPKFAWQCVKRSYISQVGRWSSSLRIR